MERQSWVLQTPEHAQNLHIMAAACPCSATHIAFQRGLVSAFSACVMCKRPVVVVLVHHTSSALHSAAHHANQESTLQELHDVEMFCGGWIQDDATAEQYIHIAKLYMFLPAVLQTLQLIAAYCKTLNLQ